MKVNRFPTWCYIYSAKCLTLSKGLIAKYYYSKHCTFPVKHFPWNTLIKKKPKEKLSIMCENV